MAVEWSGKLTKSGKKIYVAKKPTYTASRTSTVVSSGYKLPSTKSFTGSTSHVSPVRSTETKRYYTPPKKSIPTAFQSFAPKSTIPKPTRPTITASNLFGTSKNILKLGEKEIKPRPKPKESTVSYLKTQTMKDIYGKKEPMGVSADYFTGAITKKEPGMSYFKPETKITTKKESSVSYLSPEIQKDIYGTQKKDTWLDRYKKSITSPMVPFAGAVPYTTVTPTMRKEPMGVSANYFTGETTKKEPGMSYFKAESKIVTKKEPLSVSANYFTGATTKKEPGMSYFTDEIRQKREAENIKVKSKDLELQWNAMQKFPSWSPERTAAKKAYDIEYDKYIKMSSGVEPVEKSWYGKVKDKYKEGYQKWDAALSDKHTWIGKAGEFGRDVVDKGVELTGLKSYHKQSQRDVDIMIREKNRKIVEWSQTPWESPKAQKLKVEIEELQNEINKEAKYAGRRETAIGQAKYQPVEKFVTPGLRLVGDIAGLKVAGGVWEKVKKPVKAVTTFVPKTTTWALTKVPGVAKIAAKPGKVGTVYRLGKMYLDLKIINKLGNEVIDVAKGKEEKKVVNKFGGINEQRRIYEDMLRVEQKAAADVPVSTSGAWVGKKATQAYSFLLPSLSKQKLEGEKYVYNEYKKLGATDAEANTMVDYISKNYRDQKQGLEIYKTLMIEGIANQMGGITEPARHASLSAKGYFKEVIGKGGVAVWEPTKKWIQTGGIKRGIKMIPAILTPGFAEGSGTVLNYFQSRDSDRPVIPENKWVEGTPAIDTTTDKKYPTKTFDVTQEEYNKILAKQEKEDTRYITVLGRDVVDKKYFETLKNEGGIKDSKDIFWDKRLNVDPNAEKVNKIYNVKMDDGTTTQVVHGIKTEATKGHYETDYGIVPAMAIGGLIGMMTAGTYRFGQEALTKYTPIEKIVPKVSGKRSRGIETIKTTKGGIVTKTKAVEHVNIQSAAKKKLMTSVDIKPSRVWEWLGYIADPAELPGDIATPYTTAPYLLGAGSARPKTFTFINNIISNIKSGGKTGTTTKTKTETKEPVTEQPTDITKVSDITKVNQPVTTTSLAQTAGITDVNVREETINLKPRFPLSRRTQLTRVDTIPENVKNLATLEIEEPIPPKEPIPPPAKVFNYVPVEVDVPVDTKVDEPVDTKVDEPVDEPVEVDEPVNQPVQVNVFTPKVPLLAGGFPFGRRRSGSGLGVGGWNVDNLIRDIAGEWKTKKLIEGEGQFVPLSYQPEGNAEVDQLAYLEEGGFDPSAITGVTSTDVQKGGIILDNPEEVL